MHKIVHSRSQELLDFAFEFAKISHDNKSLTEDKKYRKYTLEPYWYHCIEVAQIINKYATDRFKNDIEVLCGALLHDVLEDTTVTYDELFDSGFRNGISFYVREVTDISKSSDGNRSIRKMIDREHLRNASAGGQTIKLADLISNSKSIILCDDGFAKVFMKEFKLLLEVLTKGDVNLYRICEQILNDYYTN